MVTPRSRFVSANVALTCVTVAVLFKKQGFLLSNSLEKEPPSLPKKQNKFKLLGKLKTKYQQFKQFVKKNPKSSRARVGLPGRN